MTCSAPWRLKDLSVSSGKTQLGAENKEGKAIANLARRVTVAEAVLEELRSMTRGTQPFYHAKPPDRRQQNTLVDMAGSIDLDGSEARERGVGSLQIAVFRGALERVGAEDVRRYRIPGGQYAPVQ